MFGVSSSRLTARRIVQPVLGLVLLLSSGLAVELRAQAVLINQWTFNDALNPGRDSVGSADGNFFGGASRTTDGQLSVDGISGFFITSALGTSGTIGPMSLAVWVTLLNNTQGAGSALTIGSFSGGDTFDGIIFAEHTTGQWMAGSDFAQRTGAGDNGGALETRVNSPIFMVITYDNSSNRVTIYRDGVVYASYVSAGPLLAYSASTAQALLGLRHEDLIGQGASAAGQDGYLAATIDEARIYLGALSAGEVVSIFSTGPVAVPEPATVGLLLLGLGFIAAQFRLRRRA